MKPNRTTLALLPLLAVTTACSWTVPAHPGRNAALRSRSVTADPYVARGPGPSTTASVDESAGQVYAHRCSRCHAPYSPSAYSAAEWPSILVKFGPRAGLVGTERARVLAWLQAHAR